MVENKKRRNSGNGKEPKRVTQDEVEKEVLGTYEKEGWRVNKGQSEDGQTVDRELKRDKWRWR